jgi:hypothetical protein
MVLSQLNSRLGFNPGLTLYIFQFYLVDVGWESNMVDQFFFIIPRGTVLGCAFGSVVAG